MFYEYIYYAHHYDAKLKIWEIFSRSFSVNVAARVFLLLLIFLIIIRLLKSSGCSFLPPAKYLLFIPWWLLYRSLDMDYSQLDYAKWIREPHGLDYAEGMASNYFHGYLNLILPADKSHPGLHDRMDVYEEKYNVSFALKRLVCAVRCSVSKLYFFYLIFFAGYCYTRHFLFTWQNSKFIADKGRCAGKLLLSYS